MGRKGKNLVGLSQLSKLSAAHSFPDFARHVNVTDRAGIRRRRMYWIRFEIVKVIIILGQGRKGRWEGRVRETDAG